MTDEPRGAQGTIGESPTTSMDLATIPVEERGLRGLQIAEGMFPVEHRRQIAALLHVPANSDALLPYLALCVAEGFSPWANHVWLIPKKVKVQSADGSGEVEELKHIPAVGRDGLLHKARQTIGMRGGYRGLVFGVVCERDSFEVEYHGDVMADPHVLHRYASKPTTFAADEAPDRYRGRVIGAWAKLLLDGMPPVFYFANLREHGKLTAVWAWNDARKRRCPLYFDEEGRQQFEEMGPNGRRRPVQEWAGAWDYLSTMILKSAQSYVCRIGLGVTGFVPVDELRDVSAWQQDTGAAQAAAVGTVAIDAFAADEALPNVSAELRERTQRAIDEANDREPFSWAPAKCEMVLTGRSEDELAELVEGIERENALRAERAARAEQAVEEAEVADAEVVEQAPPAPERVPSPEDAAKLEAQRHHYADLECLRDEAAPGSEEHARLSAELDQVEEEIRRLGGALPGQSDSGV